MSVVFLTVSNAFGFRQCFQNADGDTHWTATRQLASEVGNARKKLESKMNAPKSLKKEVKGYRKVKEAEVRSKKMKRSMSRGNL